jgi:hypothetical protein
MPQSAREILDREFLEIRARILDIAASLDRLSRAAEAVEEDPRLLQIRRGLAVLQGQKADRAEQVQTVFSLPYDPDWKARFQLSTPR